MIERIVENIPSPVMHVVGLGSGLSGLALWAEWAKHLTVIAGMFAAFLTVVGAGCYAGYWAVKWYARWKRVIKGDLSE
jgi:hypothetical protein